MQQQQILQDVQQKLELFLSCQNLADLDTFSVSDPFVIMFVRNEKGIYIEYKRTEVIWNNLNPSFVNSIIVEYYFETQQHLKFEVYHFVSDKKSLLIGAAEITLSELTGSRDKQLIKKLINQRGVEQGKLIIKAEQVQMCNDEVQIVFAVKKIQNPHCMSWLFGNLNPFLRLYRVRGDDKNPILVYETEAVKSQKDVRFKPIVVKVQKLCNGDYGMQMKIELWNWKSNGFHQLLGSTHTSLGELRSQEFTKLDINKNKKVMGILLVEDFQLKEKASFIDYIMSGIQLNLVVAIDFSASNGNPYFPTSLHYRDPQGRFNQYQTAILKVGEILINYDYDQLVPVYGFGCKPKLPTLYSMQTLNCFPINGNVQKPEVQGLQGILQAYSLFLNQCEFYGPTVLTPLLNETMRIATVCRDLGSDNYFILLILTDGEIHDIETVKDAIVASSHLPISIIIIGIGNADFSDMIMIDDDKMQMIDRYGKKTQRDLVQFVPFNQYKDNPSLLAKNVLEELPDQLVEYFELIGRKPSIQNLIDPSNLNIVNLNMGGTNVEGPKYSQSQKLQQKQENYKVDSKPSFRKVSTQDI